MKKNNKRILGRVVISSLVQLSNLQEIKDKKDKKYIFSKIKRDIRQSIMEKLREIKEEDIKFKIYSA